MDMDLYAVSVVNEAVRRAGGEMQFASLSGPKRKQHLRMAAEGLRYSFPKEYACTSDLSAAFAIYRSAPNRVDVATALAENEEAQKGMAIQRRIGTLVRGITRKYENKHTPLLAEGDEGEMARRINGNTSDVQVATNGIDPTKLQRRIHAAQQRPVSGTKIEWTKEPVTPRLIDVEPVAVAETAPAKPSRPDMSYGTIINLYRKMAEELAILPTDEMFSLMLGCGVATASKCRETLRGEGYKFEKMDLTGSRYHLWQVVVRGSEVAKAREQAAERNAKRQEAQALLAEQVKTMDGEQLAALIALLKQ